MKTFDSIIAEVPMLKRYAQTANQLKELPWMEIAKKIADGIRRKDERLDSAEQLMYVDELRDYINRWRIESKTVDKVIGWELFGGDGPKKLAETLVKELEQLKATHEKSIIALTTNENGKNDDLEKMVERIDEISRKIEAKATQVSLAVKSS